MTNIGEGTVGAIDKIFLAFFGFLFTRVSGVSTITDKLKSSPMF